MRLILCLALLLVLVSAAGAAAPDKPLVAVVFGQRSFDSDPTGEGLGAKTSMETVQLALDEVGVRYDTLKDADVETGQIYAYSLLLFPYNFVFPEAEEKALLAYVERGGKAFFCYSIPTKTADKLGVHVGATREGDFQSIRFGAHLIDGLPRTVRQSSPLIRHAQSKRAGTAVLGEWLDSSGKRLDEAALLLSKDGAFLTHVVTSPDRPGKGRMLLAVIGHLVPEAWPQTARHALALARARLDATAAELQTADLTPEAKRKAEGQLATGRRDLASLNRLFQQKRYDSVVDAAMLICPQP